MKLALRGLRHFRRSHAAVAAGAAVASTVLAGALVAGDSVRGSLRDLAADRLGGTDVALVSSALFRAELAEDLGAELGGAGVAPLLLRPGSAVQPDSGARASKVEVVGIDRRLAPLYAARLDLRRRPGQLFPGAALNQALARQLGARPGDELLLTLERPSAVPRESLLGDRDPDEIVVTRRFVVASVLPDRGLGAFALLPHQSAPRNAFVELGELQKALDAEGRANALLIDLPRGIEGSAPVRAALRRALELEDLELRLRRHPEHLALESRGYFLPPAAAAAAEAVARRHRVAARRVFTYLATRIEGNGRLVPYSLVAGLSRGDGLRLRDGSPAPAPAPGEVLLNRWAADDLGAAAGQRVTLRYLLPAEGGGLVEAAAVLRVAGVVDMTGLAADRSLTPALPELEEEDIAAWDAPFPVDLGLIRPRDEAYWDRYRATPKAFVAEETARRLWSGRFGRLSSVRLEPAPATDGALLAELERAVRRELPRRLRPEPFGLALREVRREALAAAEGGTDFAGLFLAFSLFLIAAAALLAGLLFSLGVERRAGELGLLLALGFPARRVRRGLLLEGGAVAAAGALLGLAGAVGYAWLVLLGLRTLWLPAVGTTHLGLHVRGSSLALGWAGALAVVVVAIAWTARRLAARPPAALLAGGSAPAAAGVLPRRRRLAPILAAAAPALAAVLLLAGGLGGEPPSPARSFAAGGALLTGGLALLSLAWRRRRGPAVTEGPRGLFAFALRNGAANPGRSLLAVAIVACASFVLAIVAASRTPAAGGMVAEAAGGFPLVAEAQVPLPRPLGGREARAALGLPSDAPELRALTAVSMRLLPGEDASCLNLYRPTRPRLLGVPPERSPLRGFRFAARLAAAGQDPWSALDLDLGPGVVPAVADAESAQWILHLGLGEDLALADESGRPLRVRLVGTLERSLFQSELLVSERQLLRHFPSLSGYRFFLLDVPAPSLAAAAALLERELGRFGFDVTPSAERMAAYLAVGNTYLSTFQTLGALGLLLGTVGLAVVLLRSVGERRGELALLRACGFTRARLARLVTLENALLLVLGTALGTTSGLLAVAPRLSGPAALAWRSLAATLAAVLVAGMASLLAAVRGALAAALLPALKEDA